MMSYTADGQVDSRLLAERDVRYGVSAQGKREERRTLDYPRVGVHPNPFSHPHTF